MVKPKVLLDFFESSYMFEKSDFQKLIVIADFLEYYSLTERPMSGIHDPVKIELVNQLMGHLIKNKFI